MNRRSNKKTLCEKLRVPRRLRGSISRRQLEMVAESEAVNRTTASGAEKQELHSKDFDCCEAVRTYLCANDHDTGSLLVSLVAATVTVEHGLDIAVGLMRGLRPKNMLETLLLSQMCATHLIATRELGKVAQSPGQEEADRYAARATRLLRTFCLQLEALETLRSKRGRQKITVRHVHIAADKALIGIQEESA